MRTGFRAMALTVALVLGASGLAAQDGGAVPEDEAVVVEYDELPEDVLHADEEGHGAALTGEGAPAQIGPRDAPAPNHAPAPASSRDMVLSQGPVRRSPVLVELFTSQGCVNCPPADAILADLAGRQDVLALSWHVDYWDYLGWRDEFARPEFTARQRDYALSFSQRSLYTPQMVVGGRHVVQQIRPAELGALISAARAEPARVTISDRVDGPRHQIEIAPRGELPADNVVQLIRYLPQRRVEVRGGENSGRHLHFTNIVTSAETLARWDGRGPIRLTVTLGAGAELAGVAPDSRHAVVVQSRRGGRPAGVIAAIKLD